MAVGLACRRAALAALCLVAVSTAAQNVTVSPTSLSYGNQVQGTNSTSKTLTLKNGQSSAITLTSISASLSDYSQKNSCPVKPSSLGAGKSCTISVTFRPGAIGTRAATLRIVDSGRNSPQTVSLSGTGVPAVSVSSSSLSFGSQAVGVKSAASNITLKNNQSVALAISKISTSLADYSTTTGCPVNGGSLAAGGSCSISIFFAPATTGTRLGTLTISSNANNSPQVSLSGTGIIPAVATPANLDFGNQAWGTSSAPQMVTFTNNQSSAIKLTSITITPPVFTFTSNCPISPAVVGAGASCSASVIYTPAQIGAKTGTLTFKSTASNSPQSVALAGTGTAAKLTSLAVSPVSPAIPSGTTQQFAALGTYSNGATKDVTGSVTWSSSAPAIANVSGGGMATGTAPGSASITAASGSVAASSTLSVGAAALMSIAVTPPNASFALGTTLGLKATGTYTDGSTQDLSGSVAWSVTNSGIATVNNQGMVSGTLPGNATVTAALGAAAGQTGITVSPAALISIAVTPAIPAVPMGATQQFRATGTFTDGSTQDVTTTVEWSSQDGSIAGIGNDASNQGLATAVGMGTSTIAASSGSITGSTTLTVTAGLVSIAIAPGDASIALGTKQQFIATGTFSDGTTQDLTSSATWSSDSSSVAAISQGLATSGAPGTAVIRASAGSISGSVSLTVTPAELVSIAITPEAPSVPSGVPQQFMAVGTYTDGSTQEVTQIGHWTSTVPNVATISDDAETRGLASTLGTGDTTIGISSGSVSAAATLTVKAAELKAIAIAPADITIPLGTNQQFSANGTYTDGTTQDLTSAATWSSSLAAAAVISNNAGENGLATSSGIGATNVSATLGAVSGSTTLTVATAALTAISVSPASISVPLGGRQQFTATGTYTDGSSQDLTGSVVWSSDSAQAASLETSGVAVAVGLGGVTITASLGNTRSSAIMTVGPPVVVSLAVNPPASVLAAGRRQQFTATGTYSDGGVLDLSASVAWDSSDRGLAWVDGTGLANAIAAGTTSVSATFGSISASAGVIITPPEPVSLSISPSQNSIYVKGSQQFSAVLLNSDGSTTDVSESAIWSASPPRLISISGTGLVTAASAGAASVQASWGENGLSAAATLDIQPLAVTVLPPSSSIGVSGTQQFSASVEGTSNQEVNWAVDGVTGGNGNIGTITPDGLYSAPAMVGAHQVTASSQEDGSSVGTASVTAGVLAPLDNGFFGMHLNSANSPIPAMMEGAARIWNSASAQWPQLNTADGKFGWKNLDTVLAAYKNAGINDILYTLGRLPKWASSNPGDTGCDFSNQGTNFTGSCDLPADLNPDGTGTDFIWRNWVQNIAQHVNDPTYLQTHAKISYWEPCNECYRTPTLTPGYPAGASVAFRGTYAQLVRMIQDARCIIAGNPNDPITALNTTCGQAGYPVTGIDPTAKIVMPSTSPVQVNTHAPVYAQVTQNLLYCTCANNSCSASSTGCSTGSAGSAAVDVISVHLYATGYTPEQIPSQVATVRSYLKPVDLAKPFWSDEGSWNQNTNSQLGGGDPDLEAAFVARYLIMMRAAGVERAYWYAWDNAGMGTLWSATGIPGCSTPFTSGYLCQSGLAYRQVHDWLIGSTLTGCSSSGTLWTCNLLQSDGSPAQILWDTSQTCANGACSTAEHTLTPDFASYTDLSGASFNLDQSVAVGIKPILVTRH